LVDDTEPPAEAHVPPFKHAEVGLLVSRAWDGCLSPDEEKWLERHLRECGECSKASARLLGFLIRMADALDEGRNPSA